MGAVVPMILLIHDCQNIQAFSDAYFPVREKAGHRKLLFC